MAKRKLQAKNSIKFLKMKLKSKDYIEIRDRIRVVIYALKGQTDRNIADRLDYSLGWVKKWVARYNQDGFDGLYDQARPGAPTLLTDKQIAILNTDILAGPNPKGILSRYRVSDLRQLVLKKFGVEYSPSGMHALMKRMKLSHVKPRPQHPKNDPLVIAAWKKKGSSLSGKTKPPLSEKRHPSLVSRRSAIRPKRNRQ